jgi:uncharacterized protein (TIGR02145 family)
MKKIYTIIFLSLALIKVQAQDYFISFAGAGAATTVDTVKVYNLTTGATVTLKGSDILHLIPSLGIGAMSADNRDLHLYPNPMEEQSTLDFVTSETGTSTISLVDLYGQTVYQISEKLSPGKHTFCVSGIQRGLYFVKVKGNDFYYSGKLISRCNLPGEPKIEHVSSVAGSEGIHLKSAAATIDMPYTDGNILMYKSITGQYSTVVTDVPTGNKITTFNYVDCTDADGNHYTTVHTATGTSSAQTWMAENLKVGVRINVSQSQANNGIIERYCYDDNDNNCFLYGGLYQWNEMMQYVETLGVIKGICPDGWHIPTIDEWGVLITYLGGMDIAGSKLKEYGNTHWLSPNNDATNESGFTALPAGWFDSVFANGFSDIGGLAYFWTALSKSGFFIDYYYLELSYNWHFVYILENPPRWDGLSVRCIAD